MVSRPEITTEDCYKPLLGGFIDSEPVLYNSGFGSTSGQLDVVFFIFKRVCRIRTILLQ